MEESGFLKKLQRAGNFARDAYYYTKALTNVLPGQTWTKPDAGLEESIRSAYGRSVGRGDGKTIAYPDWNDDPAGKRVIGQATIQKSDDGKSIKVNDTYDFYDGVIGEEYKQAYQQKIDEALKRRSWDDLDFLAQASATNIYKKKQELMPWADPRIEYEIDISDTPSGGTSSGPQMPGFISKSMEALNNFLTGSNPPDGDIPTAVDAPPAPRYSDYSVKPGDNLTAIAQNHGMSLDELLALNEQYRKNPNMVQVGAPVRLLNKALQ